MKPVKLTPRKTSEGWLLNIPAALSDSGKRQRRFFPSRDEAEKTAGPLRLKYREGTAGNILPPDQHRAAVEALNKLEGRDPQELVAAVKLWMETHDHASKSITFKKACEEFRTAKSKSHLTEKYLLNFKRYPDRFSCIADKLLVNISTADLEKELSHLPAPAKNTAADHLSSLWSFSIPKAWAILNPLDNLERAHVKKPTIPILTSRQVRLLFVATLRLYPEMVPFIAVEVFAGIRPEESEKLRWEHIDMEDNIITIPDEISKTRICRHIEMHDTLVSWLQWHKDHGGLTTGKVCPPMPKRIKKTKKKGKPAPPPDPEEISPAILRHRLRAIRKRAKIVPWPQDVLRHTFASASLASEWRNIGKLCMELGHSDQKMLSRHYARSMRRKAGEAVFQVLPMRMKPGTSSKILQFTAAA